MALYIDGKIVTGWADTNYSEVTLWSGSETSSSSGATITLSDNITNYDDIIFVAHANNSTDVGFARFNVSLLTIGNTYLQDVYDPNMFTIFWGLDSSTQIKWYSATQQRAIIVTEIIGIKYGNGTETFHSYSTAEKVVGTWVDGSTLYEKTVTFTTPNSNAYTQQSLGLTGAEVDKIWVVEGVVIKGITSSSIMGYVSSVAAEQFSGFVNKGTNVTLDYRVGASLYQGDGFVTVRYTKSSS